MAAWKQQRADKMTSVAKPNTMPALAVAAMALAAFCLVFLRGVDNGFVSDDWVFLYQAWKADSVSAVLGFLRFDTDWFVRPTQWLLTAALYRAAERQPVWYHLTSIGLHLANAILVFVLWRGLFSREATRAESVFLAIGAAILFVFHRRHHEVVFWYSSISESLATWFRLATLLLLWKSFDRKERPDWRLASSSFATTGLALLSKESAAVLPGEAALLLVAEFLTRPRYRRLWIGQRLAAWAGIAASTGLWMAIYFSSARRAAAAGLVQRSDLTFLTATPAEWLFRFEHAFLRCYKATWLPGNPRLLAVLAAIGAAFLALALLRRRFLPVVAGLFVLVSLAPYVATTAVADVAMRVPPLLRETGIGDDRYYYYPSIAAGALLLALGRWFASETGRFLGVSAMAVVRGIVLMSCVGYAAWNARALVRAEADWDRAGELAARVISGTRAAVPVVSRNAVLCVENVPDNHRGKLVLRNGPKEALYLAYQRDDFGIAINEQRNGRGCTWTVTWSAEDEQVYAARSADAYLLLFRTCRALP